jgi:hypothetical protein
MQTELYADGIGEITVSGSIVRIDLVSLSATHKDANGQPVPEFRQRLILSTEGFANSFEVLQKAMDGLIEAGAIRRNMPAQPMTAPAGLAPEAHKTNGSAPRLNGSPNFA